MFILCISNTIPAKVEARIALVSISGTTVCDGKSDPVTLPNTLLPATISVTGFSYFVIALESYPKNFNAPPFLALSSSARSALDLL